MNSRHKLHWLLFCCCCLFFVDSTQDNITRSHFPDGFLFGVSTSSYQIEGAYLEDGKSLNNWDEFSISQGIVENGENGFIADDHYHRYLKDIETVQSLGVDAYRFSISWARILPRGKFGEANPKGIMFYNKILDNLVQRGIEPFVTVYHHDFPQELEDRYGSWLSPLMQDDYAHFAETCFENFGDRVKHWMTINEPNLFASMAYEKGMYPPARCSQPFGNCSAGNSDVEPFVVMHNLLLAHAKAVKLYRKDYQREQGGSVGIVIDCLMYEPLTDDDLDREAANRGMAFYIGWALDPLIFGDYPAEMRRFLGSQLPRFSSAEREYVKDSVDYIAVNHYTATYAKDCIHSSCNSVGNRAIKGFVDQTKERDGVLIGEATGIEVLYVVPRSIKEMIEYLKKRYRNKPMFVTENGYSEPNGQEMQVQEILEDVKRIEFHKQYLSYLAEAISDGADVRGYFVWTLMDDFEWIHGYEPRFGLYYVDRQTLDRRPKLSARWYQDFLRNNSLNGHQKVTVNRNSFEQEGLIVSEVVRKGKMVNYS